MLISKLYVPKTCSQGDRLVTYILWPGNEEITITLTKPELWKIEEIYNHVPPKETNNGVIKFSRSIFKGYLGIILRIPLSEEITRMDKLVFEIDNGSGLSEVYEKEVFVFKQSAVSPATSCNNVREFRTQEQTLLEQQPQKDLRCISVPQIISDGPHIHKERDIITREMQKIFTKTDIIGNDLRCEFRIEGTHLTLLCQENRLKYDLVLVPVVSRPLPKTVKFTHVIPSRVNIVHLPDLNQIPEAIVYTDDGYKIKLNHLLIGERYLLSLEFRVSDLTVLEVLIDTTCYKDMNDPDTTSQNYTICALLKYPEIFHKDSCDIEIHDIGIPVAIRMDRNLSEMLDNWKKHKQEHGLSQFFENNISVSGDFSSQRKDIRYNFPIHAPCPDNIRIILYMDLSTSKPAASGILSLKSVGG
jgi:hypothetical protein